jgi:hypothetical protein
MLRELALRERVCEGWRNVWEAPCGYAVLRCLSGCVFGNAGGKHVLGQDLKKACFHMIIPLTIPGRYFSR